LIHAELADHDKELPESLRRGGGRLMVASVVGYPRSVSHQAVMARSNGFDQGLTDFRFALLNGMPMASIMCGQHGRTGTCEDDAR
jgi:hypothetical protein